MEKNKNGLVNFACVKLSYHVKYISIISSDTPLLRTLKKMCITKSQFFFVQNSTNLSVHHDLATSNQPQRVYPVVVEVNPH